MSPISTKTIILTVQQEPELLIKSLLKQLRGGTKYKKI